MTARKVFSKAFFLHLNVGAGKATLAIQERQSGEEQVLVAVGIAFCSPQDHYSRKTGRNKAFGRLTKFLVSEGQDKGDLQVFSFMREEGKIIPQVLNYFGRWVSCLDNIRPGCVPTWVIRCPFCAKKHDSVFAWPMKSPLPEGAHMQMETAS